MNNTQFTEGGNISWKLPMFASERLILKEKWRPSFL